MTVMTIPNIVDLPNIVYHVLRPASLVIYKRHHLCALSAWRII